MKSFTLRDMPEGEVQIVEEHVSTMRIAGTLIFLVGIFLSIPGIMSVLAETSAIPTIALTLWLTASTLTTLMGIAIFFSREVEVRFSKHSRQKP